MDILEARGSTRPLAEADITISSGMIDEDSVIIESSSIIADDIVMQASAKGLADPLASRISI